MTAVKLNVHHSNADAAGWVEGMTDWFHPLRHQPSRVGAYECVTMYGKTIDEARATNTHYRWWNGEQWSFPIEGNLDDEFAAPPEDRYPLLDAEYLPFAFRGFNEDPDPL